MIRKDISSEGMSEQVCVYSCSSFVQIQWEGTGILDQHIHLAISDT